MAKLIQGNFKNLKAETIADLRNITGHFQDQTIDVAGYFSSGDGGGGPTRYWQTGDVIGTHVDNGGSIIVPTGGDGSEAWLFTGADDIINPLNWGVASIKRTGLTTYDSTTSYQNQIDYITTSGLFEEGATIVTPDGEYIISTITLERTFETDPNISFVGTSFRSTIFRSTTDASLLIINGRRTSNDTQSFQIIGNFSLFGDSGTTVQTGIEINLSPFIRLENILISGMNDGIIGIDCDQITWDKVIFRFNERAYTMRASSGLTGQTRPNIWTLLNCHVGANTERGGLIEGGAAIKFVNGSFERNGTDLAGSGYGLRLEMLGAEGAVSLDNVFFESNNGEADFIVNNVNTQLGTDTGSNSISVNSCVFSRATAEFTAPNCIKMILGSVSTYGTIRLRVTGCTFKHYNDYVPNASNKYIRYSSATTATTDNFYQNGNFYMSDIETPDVSEEGIYYMSVGLTGNLVVATATPTAIVPDILLRSYTFDTSTLSSITIPLNGFYSVTSIIVTTAATAGDRFINTYLDGTRILRDMDNGSNTMTSAGTIFCTEGQLLTFEYEQNTGGDITILASTISKTSFTAALVTPSSGGASA